MYTITLTKEFSVTKKINHDVSFIQFGLGKSDIFTSLFNHILRIFYLALEKKMKWILLGDYNCEHLGKSISFFGYGESGLFNAVARKIYENPPK